MAPKRKASAKSSAPPETVEIEEKEQEPVSSEEPKEEEPRAATTEADEEAGHQQQPEDAQDDEDQEGAGKALEEGDENKDEDEDEDEGADEENSEKTNDPPTSTTGNLAAPPPAEGSTSSSTSPTQYEWQAVYAPTYNAYYFYNTRTGETTWTNPLDPSASAGTSADASTSAATGPSAPPSVPETISSNPWAAPPSNPEVEGIDPLLYHLDPTLALSSAAGGPAVEYTATARFNAHTGRFEADPTKRPERMGEWERMKRMSEVYFDTDKWEKEVEERKEREAEEGLKRKRPSKKDLERFAEQRKRKKIAKTAWLRN